MPTSRRAAAAAPAPRPLTLDDLARLAAIHDPVLSTDGRRVAVVVERVDEAANDLRRRLVVFDVATPGRRRTVATGNRRFGQPRWSPDGRCLAYLADRGAERAQLEVIGVGTDGAAHGSPTRLTDVKTGISAAAWSPDGRWLAFVANGADRAGEPVPPTEFDDRRRTVGVRGFRHKVEGSGWFTVDGPRPHVWLVAADGRSGPRQLTDGQFEDSEPAWSPDGTSIAFVSDRSKAFDEHFGGTAIHVVDVASGRARRLTSEGRSSSLPSWSPDGRRIAFVSSDAPLSVDGRTERLWVVDVKSGREECWTADLDRSVGFRPGGYRTPSRPAWAPDGRSVLHLITHDGTTQLARISAGIVDWLTREDQVVQEVSVSADGSTALLQRTDAVTPAELWRWDAASGARRLAGFNDRWSRDVAVHRPEHRSVERAGFRIHGWLTRPAASGRRPVPLVLVVHGGPHNAFGHVFNSEVQLWAAHGYAVLQVNPRGSGSYGEAFARAVIRDWGGADWEDIVAVLNSVLADRAAGIDAARTALTGGSYGGFMTCWAITQTDRFAVAIAGAPLTNLESMYGTADIGPSWFADEIGGTPLDAYDRFRSRSALPLAARVRTPLLLYHGEADLRVPIEQSEQFFTALTALGHDVELLRVPAEGHVLPGDASPVHRRIVREMILEWLDRYLRPSGATVLRRRTSSSQ
jgi:dipeptidyl aminopeptidase/acylaminoacyl peptidase